MPFWIIQGTLWLTIPSLHKLGSPKKVFEGSAARFGNVPSLRRCRPISFHFPPALQTLYVSSSALSYMSPERTRGRSAVAIFSAANCCAHMRTHTPTHSSTHPPTHPHTHTHTHTYITPAPPLARPYHKRVCVRACVRVSARGPLCTAGQPPPSRCEAACGRRGAGGLTQATPLSQTNRPSAVVPFGSKRAGRRPKSRGPGGR